MSLDASIIIVGTGVFGASTAWHLARRGYKNVLCIDPFPSPSKRSAANDISKVIRTQYKDPLYSKLAHEALAEWNKAPLSKVFHQCGVAYLDSNLFERNLSATDAAHDLGRTFADIGKYGDDSLVRELTSAAAVKDACHIEGSKLETFRGWIDGSNGWAEAAAALQIVVQEAAKLGVRFENGDKGTMTELLRSEDGNVIGVLTGDGTRRLADKVVLATGGWSDSLFDFEGQLLAGAYSTTHIQLTQAEADMLRARALPVIAVDSVGFMLPVTDDNILKVCDLEPGKTNLVKVEGRSEKISVPDTAAFESGVAHTLPARDQIQSRAVLKYLLPDFEDHPLFFSRLCWDTQSSDAGWIIGPHPSSPSSLFFATGGSGHTFKNLPTVGMYVVDALEDKLDAELAEAWRWRPDRVNGIVPNSLYDLNDPSPPVPRL